MMPRGPSASKFPESEPAHPGRLASLRRLPLAAYVFAGAFVLRLICLTRLTASASLLPNGGDIAFYHEWAQRILAGEWSDGRAFYGLPLYAYWLAAVYALTGVNAFVPGLLQCAFDAGTALLLYKITAHILREHETAGARTTGAIAAAVWVFYVPAETFAIVRMPATIAVFVWWFVVWQVVKRTEPPPLRTLFVLGLLIGIVAMGVATILFVVPLLVAALIWRWRAKMTRAAVVLLVGVVLGAAPCWLHNIFIAHDPVFLSAHSGINFWIGNNPDATGYPHFGEVRAGQAEMLQDSIAIAERAAGRPLKRSEVAAYWSGRARAFIAAHPGQWLSLLGRKLWNFWNAFPYDDLSVVAMLRDEHVTLPGFGFGLIAAFAIAGTPIALRVFRTSRWIVA
ncbi:MAG TPA: hypothetical protein VF511_00490, partial [Chthoniobacterales bacterium]